MAQKRMLRIIWAVSALKLLIIANIPQALPTSYPGAWLGADGETYLDVARVLNKEGVFSSDSRLFYFAPGYSAFLWMVSIPNEKLVFFIAAAVQTLAFSYSIYYLGKQLLGIGMIKLAIGFVALAQLNPTLSLASLVIGYESLIASACTLAIALLLKVRLEKSEKPEHPWLVSLAFLLIGSTIWLSPRMVLPSVLILIIWFFVNPKTKRSVTAALLSVMILASFQSSLIMRNEIATGNRVTQSSLGTLAIMGAGPNATGTYTNEDTGIVCEISGLNESEASNKKLRCAFNWYLDNPLKGATLIWKKSYYLWSPWFGPLYGGTMARNPYLYFHPVKSLITTQEQLDIAMGIPGKIISWVWILCGWLLMILGIRFLLKSGGNERLLGAFILVLIASTWLITLMVQGDNRYRIPVMPFSLLVQVYGFQVIRSIRNRKRS